MIMMETLSILYGIYSGCFLFPLFYFFTVLFANILIGFAKVLNVLFLVFAVSFHIIRFCRFLVGLYIFKYIFDICPNFTMTQYFLLFLGCMWMSYNVIYKYLKKRQRHRRQAVRTQQAVRTIIHNW